MAQRIHTLRTWLQDAGLDALLITNPFNRKYMTGFTGTSGYVLIAGDRAALITDFRYIEQAAEQAKAYEIIQHGLNPLETILQTLQQWRIAKLGFEQDHFTYAEYLKYTNTMTSIQFVVTNRLVERLRQIKDAGELKTIQAAAELADRTFEHILKQIRPGVSERDLALEIEFFMRKHGATSSAFDTIVASGERSALPHGVASERILQSGDFVTLDFGALYQGYCSDITRTVVLGKATDRHREIYHIVLEAQQQAIAQIRPGMTGKEADALARSVIERFGYGERFGHGTGHGIGLEIHEAPRLSRQGETRLEPGMVMTVEPGIYLPGFGGVRIEDDIVITEHGARLLTHADKQLITIN